MRRRLWVLGLMVLVVLVAPETRATSEQWGYASAYAPGVMGEVVRYRMENDIWRNEPPMDWYTAHGYVAAMDCSTVGEMRTLVDVKGLEQCQRDVEQYTARAKAAIAAWPDNSFLLELADHMVNRVK